MQISQFNYKLPKERIAHSPTEPRDSSKLMVLDRKTGSIEHKHFSDLAHILTANDVLVFNKTKVIPARIFGYKESGGKVEILLLEKVSSDSNKKIIWNCIGKNIPNINKKIIFDKNFKATVIDKNEKVSKIQFDFSQVKFEQFLNTYGNMPLPPYIANSWHHQIDSKTRQEIKTAYNTIYADREGSVAAPTAGLHFTKRLLADLKNNDVKLEFLTLHVGLGTFEPVQSKSLHNHVMHSEYFSLSKRVAQSLNRYKKEGRRIIAVGTTTTRVLETCSDDNGVLKAKSGQTNIFIYPPYRFKFIDSLITNFHLPKSTLLSLVSAFVSEPNTDHKFKGFISSPIGHAYTEAISKNYRFYSFGDAMLIK